MNTSPPAFSVLIAAHNAETFISRTLDSVRGQSYRNFEIVVVNDGSTDNTGPALEDYRKANPGLQMAVIHQTNTGMGGARNAGVRSAQYPFIALLDHDDIWYPKKLERVAKVFNDQEDADIVCNDEFMVEEKHRRTVSRRHLRYEMPADSMYEAMLFRGKSLSGSATVVRKSRLVEVGLFPEGKEWNGVEDFDVWLKLARAGCRIHFLNEVLGEYIVHGNNLSRDVRFSERIIDVLDAHFRQWPDQSLYYKYLIRKRKADTIRGAGKALANMGDFKTAISYLLSAYCVDPLSYKTLALVLLLYLKRFAGLAAAVKETS